MVHGGKASDTRKPYSGLSRSLVIAIDVGTTFSGVSYAILEPGEIPKIHGVTRFPGQEHVAGNSKIPSVIYYDKHGKMMAAGAEADSSAVLSQAEDEGWIKAELFKLRLRPRTMTLNMNGMRLGPLPKRKTAVHVFGDFLAYLFRCTRNFITDTHAHGAALWNAVESDLQFVLSHPNGWEGAQQTKMRRAAVYGGLIPDTNEGKARIRFVTEGEASLHACVLNGLASDVLSNPMRHGFLIADAGGGTLDISAYAIRASSPLVMEEIAPPDCIFAGSVFVSRRAREFLEEKLKNSKYGTPDALDHITRRFDETTKRLFRDRGDLQFIPFGSPLDKDLAVGIRGGQLKLTGNEVANLFEPSVDAAFNAIKAQIEASQGVIKSVFLVGGYAASPWLFNQLQARLAPFRVTVSRPDTQTSKAVADGAIGFYCDHHVAARMSKFMYGVEFLRELDPRDPDHVARKERLCELPSGPKLLPDAFDCILARGVKVKESMVFTRKYCTELTSLTMLSVFEVEIWCYRGKNEIPKWIERQDDKFSTLCVVRADLSPLSGSAEPKTNRNGKTYWTIVFSVEIHFGLTEFKARIKWIDNGVTKYGPAAIVYNERGHRAEEDEPDTYPEDDLGVTSSSTPRSDRDRDRLRSEPVSRSRTPIEQHPSNSSRRASTSAPRGETPYSSSIPEVTRIERTASSKPSVSSPIIPGGYLNATNGSDSDRRRDKGKERESESFRDRERSGVSTPARRGSTAGPKIGDALSSVWGASGPSPGASPSIIAGIPSPGRSLKDHVPTVEPPVWDAPQTGEATLWDAPKPAIGDASTSPWGQGSKASPFGDLSRGIDVSRSLLDDPPRSAIGDAPRSPWGSGAVDLSPSIKSKRKSSTRTSPALGGGMTPSPFDAPPIDVVPPPEIFASNSPSLGIARQLSSKGASPSKGLSPLNPAFQMGETAYATPVMDAGDGWGAQGGGEVPEVQNGGDAWGSFDDGAPTGSRGLDPEPVVEPEPAPVVQAAPEVVEETKEATTPGGKKKKKKAGATPVTPAKSPSAFIAAAKLEEEKAAEAARIAAEQEKKREAAEAAEKARVEAEGVERAREAADAAERERLAAEERTRQEEVENARIAEGAEKTRIAEEEKRKADEEERRKADEEKKQKEDEEKKRKEDEKEEKKKKLQEEKDEKARKAQESRDAVLKKTKDAADKKAKDKEEKDRKTKEAKEEKERLAKETKEKEAKEAEELREREEIERKAKEEADKKLAEETEIKRAEEAEEERKRKEEEDKLAKEVEEMEAAAKKAEEEEEQKAKEEERKAKEEEEKAQEAEKKAKEEADKAKESEETPNTLSGSGLFSGGSDFGAGFIKPFAQTNNGDLDDTWGGGTGGTGWGSFGKSKPTTPLTPAKPSAFGGGGGGWGTNGGGSSLSFGFDGAAISSAQEPTSFFDEVTNSLSTAHNPGEDLNLSSSLSKSPGPDGQTPEGEATGAEKTDDQKIPSRVPTPTPSAAEENANGDKGEETADAMADVVSPTGDDNEGEPETPAVGNGEEAEEDLGGLNVKKGKKKKGKGPAAGGDDAVKTEPVKEDVAAPAGGKGSKKKGKKGK